MWEQFKFLVEFMLIWAIIILLTFFERIFFNSFILWRTDWSLADLLLGYSKDLVLPKYTVNSSLTDSRQFKLFKYLRKFDTKILSNFLLRCSLLWFKWKSGLILWCLIIGSPIVLHIFDRYSFTNTTFSFTASFRSTISDIVMQQDWQCYCKYVLGSKFVPRAKI